MFPEMSVKNILLKNYPHEMLFMGKKFVTHMPGNISHEALYKLMRSMHVPRRKIWRKYFMNMVLGNVK